MTTRDIISRYHDAWTSGDLKAARAVLADDLDFQGAVETHTSADGFLGGLGMFCEHLYVSCEDLELVVDGDSGFKLYDCKLKTGDTLRCAEHFHVSGGKIDRIRLVFDTAKIPAPPPA